MERVVLVLSVNLVCEHIRVWVQVIEKGNLDN